MLRSFKLKLVLSSVLLSGLLLAAFGFFCIRMAHRVGIDRIDRELRALVDAEIRKTQPRNHWRRFDESLQNLFGTTAPKQYLLKVADAENELLFESPQWQDELGNAKLPQSASVPAPATVPEAGRPRPASQPQQKRPPAPAPLEASAARFSTIGTWRVMAIRNPEVNLVLAINLEPLDAELVRFRNALLLAIPLALLLMVGGGWLLAQLALRPVNAIARTAKKVTALHLDERIPAAGADREFRQLVDVINEMLGRLEASFRQAVRFSADAAHELKTPLTILQGVLENALQSAPDGSADQQTYQAALDEVLRLKSIILKLLLLAQADSGQMLLGKEAVNLTRLIGVVCGDLRILAPDLEIQAELQPDVQVLADPDLLNQVIQNMASNAVKFCRGESPVILALKTEGNCAVFRISNRGETIPPEERNRVFERFYRANKSRNRAIDGSGLGLSLAREIARAHGGTLELEDAADQTVFCLALPRITEP